jgi:hypothetical protein
MITIILLLLRLEPVTAHHFELAVVRCVTRPVGPEGN